MKNKTTIVLILVILLVGVLMSGCSGLNEADNQIIDTVLRNSDKWNKSDTFNMNFTSYEGKPAIRVWSGDSVHNPFYVVQYDTWVIDYEKNSMSLEDTTVSGVDMPDSLRNGNSFPKDSSDDEKREYLKKKYVAWKKN